MIDKTYQQSAIEGRIYAQWEEAGAFRAGRPERRSARPYCIVIPPPNVTGSLHMGHALNNTLQDVLVRFERMRGRDVLWQPGTDHAGIATQMVVERLIERSGQDRRALGRNKFLEKVWAWKAEAGGTITQQLKRLGASCDWSRERFTMDEGLSRAVRKVFVDLYRADLIYKAKRLVNWDPKLLTAISDLEVQQVEVRGHLWHIRYPLEGANFDPNDASTFITVATTRPETMLGDVAVAVHPDDERYRHLVGKHTILPLVGRRIPIIADEYSDPEKGTGAVKITPAHDFNDFEVGKRHALPIINILNAEARLFLQGNDDFLLGLPAQEHFWNQIESPLRNILTLGDVLSLNAWDRFDARKKIVELLQARDLAAKIELHVHMVPHGDRSGEVIEPWLTDQWYVNAKTLAQPALAAVREGRTSFIPKNWEKTYFDWLENIQPWCISRQLWWGHQIPAWYGPRKGVDGPKPLDITSLASVTASRDFEIFVANSETEALQAARTFYGAEVRIVSNAVNAAVAQHDTGIVHLWRDEDVLDTWFSSALWPFSTLGWPDETAELERYYPTDVLVTGFDIIFFWVARMMMMGLHFMQEVPFHTVYIHALVRDERGAKMSKSKGNVIDPLELIDEYGADALRFTLAAMAAQGRDIKLSTQRVEGYRNFATKLWNACRFAEMNHCATVPGFDPKSARDTLNRWIARETAKAAREITEAIEAYKFNEAAGAAYHFVWDIFCDWYLELAKPVLQGVDGVAKPLRSLEASRRSRRGAVEMNLVSKTALRKLRELGLYRGKLPRGKLSKYQQSLIKRFDDVLKGGAKVLQPKSPKDYSSLYVVKSDKVIVPKRKGEKIKVNKHGNIEWECRGPRGEKIKGTLPAELPPRDETRAMTAWARDEILKLLHPFMPFVTEELWQVTAVQERDELLALTPWSNLSNIEGAFSDVDMQVALDVVSELRSIRTTFNIPTKEKLSSTALNFNAANTATLTANTSSIDRLANTTITVLLPAEAQTLTQDARNLSSGIMIRTPIREGEVVTGVPASFLAAEKTRLEKELARVKSDIARIDAKLSNADFVARAPEDVVEGEREKREEAEMHRLKINEALARLKGAA
jgi:valyl-tRNA synthetase